MQVICTDGTVLQCDRFEAIDSGVLLFNEQRGRQETTEGEEEEAADEEMEEEESEANAFVPLHQLRIVLPDGVQPGQAGGQGRAQTTPQPPTQAPPAGGMPPQGQMPPQQSPTGQPSPQGGPGQGTGPGQGRR